ncbi:MAG: hypothetical protein I8H75_06330 [Myxococcaceae bacterium]|nr:hypothetical protein [Myxococcaceae bacterium]
MRIYLLLFFLVLFVPMVRADYIVPEKLMEIASGIKVRSKSGKEIIKLKAVDRVILAYENFKPDRDDVGFVLDPDGCFVLLIHVKNGVKNYIKQFIVKDEKCF